MERKISHILCIIEPSPFPNYLLYKVSRPPTHPMILSNTILELLYPVLTFTWCLGEVLYCGPLKCWYTMPELFTLGVGVTRGLVRYGLTEILGDWVE